MWSPDGAYHRPPESCTRGVTPLLVAAERGHAAILDVLLSDLAAREDGDIAAAVGARRVSDERTAWLVAAAGGHAECCQRLWDAAGGSQAPAPAMPCAYRGQIYGASGSLLGILSYAPLAYALASPQKAQSEALQCSRFLFSVFMKCHTALAIGSRSKHIDMGSRRWRWKKKTRNHGNPWFT